MPDTYTTSNRYTQPQVGGDLNTWGDLLNQTLALVDTSNDGISNVSLAGLTAHTLTANSGLPDESRARVITFSGALAAACTVTVPRVPKVSWYLDNTTGTGIVTLTTGVGGGSTQALAKGVATVIWCDGTNIVEFGGGSSSAGGPAWLAGNLTFTPPNIWNYIGNGPGASFLIDPTTPAFTFLTAPPGVANAVATMTTVVRIGSTTVNVPGIVSAGAISANGQINTNVPGQGNVALSNGSSAAPGYVGFFNAAGTRVGVAGFLDPANSTHLELETENGFTGWTVTGNFTVAGNTVCNNFSSTGTATIASLSVTGTLTLASLTLSGTLTAGGITSSGAISGTSITSTTGRIVSSQAGATPCVTCYDSAASSGVGMYNDGGILFFSPTDGSGNPAPITSYFASMDGGNFTTTVNGFKPGGGVWGDSTSDRRAKDVLRGFSSGLDTILRLNPVVYRFRGNTGDHHTPELGEFVGLIAQDVEAIMPEMVKYKKGSIDGVEVDDFRTLDATPLLYTLLNAVKELANEVTLLRSKVGAVWR